MRELTQEEVLRVSGAGGCASENFNFGFAHLMLGAAIVGGGPLSLAAAGVGWAVSAYDAHNCANSSMEYFTMVDQYGCHQVMS